VSVDFCSVLEWIEAGCPLDKSFVVVRRSETILPGDATSEWFESETNMICSRVLHCIEGYKERLGADSFSVQLPTDIDRFIQQEYFQYLYNTHTITMIIVCTPNSLTLKAGAIVTLHSEDQ